VSEQPRITVADAIAYTRARRSAPTDPNLVARCVHCSRPPHADTVWANGDPHKYETMALPEGVTCASCVYVDRCCLIFGQLPEDRSCQWFPIRYREATPLSPDPPLAADLAAKALRPRK